MAKRPRPLEWFDGEVFNGGMARIPMATHTMWSADDSQFRCANAQMITLSEAEGENAVLKLIARNAHALGVSPVFEDMYCRELKAMRATLVARPNGGIVCAEALVKLGGGGGFQLRAHNQQARLPAEPYVMLRLLSQDGVEDVRVRRDPAESARIFPLPIAHQFFGMQQGGRWSAALESNKAVKSLWYHCRRQCRLSLGDDAILPLEAYTRGFFCDAVLESLHRVLCVPGDSFGGRGGGKRDDPWGLFADFVSAISGVLLHVRDAERGTEYLERKRRQHAASHAAPRDSAPDGIVGMPDVILWTNAPQPGGRGAEVSFVEVKTKDSLSASQRAILRGLGWVDERSAAGGGAGGVGFSAASGANGAGDEAREESDDSDDSACAKAELASERETGAGEGGLEAAIARMGRVVAEYARHGVTITGALERCQT